MADIRTPGPPVAIQKDTKVLGPQRDEGAKTQGATGSDVRCEPCDMPPISLVGDLVRRSWQAVYLCLSSPICQRCGGHKYTGIACGDKERHEGSKLFRFTKELTSARSKYVSRDDLR